jgi:hypothetical protein
VELLALAVGDALADGVLADLAAAVLPDDRKRKNPPTASASTTKAARALMPHLRACLSRCARLSSRRW